MKILTVVAILVQKGFFKTEDDAARAIDQCRIRIGKEVLSLHRKSSTGTAYGFHLLSGNRYTIGIKKAGTNFFEDHEISV